MNKRFVEIIIRTVIWNLRRRKNFRILSNCIAKRELLFLLYSSIQEIIKIIQREKSFR